MTNLNYGTLPEYDEFSDRFDAVVDMSYHIRLSRLDSLACEDFRLGDGAWKCNVLYTALQEVITAWNSNAGINAAIDTAMDVVSSILSTLEFEWV